MKLLTLERKSPTDSYGDRWWRGLPSRAGVAVVPLVPLTAVLSPHMMAAVSGIILRIGKFKFGWELAYCFVYFVFLKAARFRRK